MGMTFNLKLSNYCSIVDVLEIKKVQISLEEYETDKLVV